MSEPVRIVGSYVSPYVRKVLVVLDLKGIPYEIDPIIPFMGNDAFSKLSPIRRIPVLIDDRVTLSDSTVICEYLDDRHPDAGRPARRPGRRARGPAGSRSSPTRAWARCYLAALQPGR